MSVSNLVTNVSEIYINQATKYMLKIDNRNTGNMLIVMTLEICE